MASREPKGQQPIFGAGSNPFGQTPMRKSGSTNRNTWQQTWAQMEAGEIELGLHLLKNIYIYIYVYLIIFTVFPLVGFKRSSSLNIFFIFWGLNQKRQKQHTQKQQKKNNENSYSNLSKSGGPRIELGGYSNERVTRRRTQGGAPSTAPWCRGSPEAKSRGNFRLRLRITF